jgi:hypothetical protein
VPASLHQSLAAEECSSGRRAAQQTPGEHTMKTRTNICAGQAANNIEPETVSF